MVFYYLSESEIWLDKRSSFWGEGPLKNILISYFSKIFFFIFQNEPPSLTFGYTLVFVTACLTLIVCLTGKYKFHPRRRIVSLKSLSSSLTSSFIKA